MHEQGDPQSSLGKLRRTIEQKIRERTFGRVQNLRVASIDGRIVVNGSTRCYFDKSLALEAAQEVGVLICPIPLVVDIQVRC